MAALDDTSALNATALHDVSPDLSRTTMYPHNENGIEAHGDAERAGDRAAGDGGHAGVQPGAGAGLPVPQALRERRHPRVRPPAAGALPRAREPVRRRVAGRRGHHLRPDGDGDAARPPPAGVAGAAAAALHHRGGAAAAAARDGPSPAAVGRRRAPARRARPGPGAAALRAVGGGRAPGRRALLPGARGARGHAGRPAAQAHHRGPGPPPQPPAPPGNALQQRARQHVRPAAAATQAGWLECKNWPPLSLLSSWSHQSPSPSVGLTRQITGRTRCPQIPRGP